MQKMQTTVPKWIVLYLWFLTLMTILFTLLGYFIPEFHNIVEFKIGDTFSLYLSRNIAIIVIYLFAIFSQRIIVYKAVFILRGVIDLVELFQNMLQFDLLGIPISMFLLIIDIFALVKLYKIKR